jgi:hypothetical protein
MAFKITSMFRDCLSRQIGDILRIHFTRDRILYSKNEYMSNRISRLIEEDAWERRGRCRQEEGAEMLELAEVEDFRKITQNIQQEPKDRMRETPHQSIQEENILRGTDHPSKRKIF